MKRTRREARTHHLARKYFRQGVDRLDRSVLLLTAATELTETVFARIERLERDVTEILPVGRVAAKRRGAP